TASPLPLARIYTVKFANAPTPSDAIDVDGPSTTSSFIAFPGTINGLVAGDLNRDGRWDLAALQVYNSDPSAAGGDSTAHTVLLPSDGVWHGKAAIPTGTLHGAGLSLADFDRDSRLDLAVAGTDPRPTAELVPSGLLSALAGDGAGGLRT